MCSTGIEDACGQFVVLCEAGSLLPHIAAGWARGVGDWAAGGLKIFEGCRPLAVDNLLVGTAAPGRMSSPEHVRLDFTLTVNERREIFLDFNDDFATQHYLGLARCTPQDHDEIRHMQQMGYFFREQDEEIRAMFEQIRLCDEMVQSFHDCKSSWIRFLSRH